MKFAVITLCTANLNYGKYSTENAMEYCNRHGYDFILYEDKIDRDAAAISNKTLTVLRNINSYDWILMKDADSLFYNFNFKLEDYIDDDYCYIGSMSQIPYMVNLGHLLIKCTPKVKEELEVIYQVIKENVTEKGEQPIYNQWWNEGRLSPVKKMDKHIFNAQSFDKIYWEGQHNLSVEELQKLDDDNMNLEARADIKKDTFIVHYPGAFLKSRSYVIEHQTYNHESDPFNFSDAHLPRFIWMFEEIKRRNAFPDIRDIPREIKVKPRTNRAKLREIKYKIKR